MRGKIAAAVITAATYRTVIANGSRAGVLAAAVAGEDVGTRSPRPRRPAPRPSSCGCVTPNRAWYA